MFKASKYHEQEVSSQPVSRQHVQCSSLHSYKLRKTVLFLPFRPSTLHTFSSITPGATVHHHEERQESEKNEKAAKGSETLPLAGSAPAIQRICIHDMGFCCSSFVVFGFFCCFCVFLFLFCFVVLLKKNIFLLRLVMQNYFSRTTIQSDSAPVGRLPIDPFLTSILL